MGSKLTEFGFLWLGRPFACFKGGTTHKLRRFVKATARAGWGMSQWPLSIELRKDSSSEEHIVASEISISYMKLGPCEWVKICKSTLFDGWILEFFDANSLSGCQKSSVTQLVGLDNLGAYKKYF